MQKKEDASFRQLAMILALCLIALCVVSSTARSADDEFPPELTQFVPYDRNPVFTAEGDGHWDVKIRERGWILREGDQWKMWFTGYDGTRAGQKKLGYATSSLNMGKTL